MLIGPKKPCAGFYAFIIIANSDIVALSIKKFPNAIEFVVVNIPVLGNLSIIVKLGEFHQLRRSSVLLLWFGHTKMYNRKRIRKLKSSVLSYPLSFGTDYSRALKIYILMTID